MLIKLTLLKVSTVEGEKIAFVFSGRVKNRFAISSSLKLETDPSLDDTRYSVIRLRSSLLMLGKTT